VAHEDACRGSDVVEGDSEFIGDHRRFLSRDELIAAAGHLDGAENGSVGNATFRALNRASLNCTEIDITEHAAARDDVMSWATAGTGAYRRRSPLERIRADRSTELAGTAA
jgi:hypothetical protein